MSRSRRFGGAEEAETFRTVRGKSSLRGGGEGERVGRGSARKDAADTFSIAQRRSGKKGGWGRGTG